MFYFQFVAQAAPQPKIALVLSGGGARGAAHIGTLEILDSLKIPIDLIVGTSMGGLVGALYATGHSGKEIEQIVLDMNWDALFTDLPSRKYLPYLEKKLTDRYQLELDLKGLTPQWPLGLIEGEKVLLYFSRTIFPYTQQINFDSLPIPFRCVAVDLVSGREVVLKKGFLPLAMRATMSIPTIFTPVPWGDSLLIDGGLVNNLPVDVAKKMGADYVIAVNVGTPLKKRKALRSVMDIFEQSFNIPGSYRENKNKKQADILIAPDLTGFSASNFTRTKIQTINKIGKQAARSAIPQLLKFRNKLFQAKQQKTRITNTGYQPAQQQLIIYGLQIEGNRSLPFSFIRDFLGIKPGDPLNLDLLERRIMLLQSLKYFKTIYYETRMVRRKYVSLIIHIRERQFRRLSLGFRYDNYHRIVVALGLQGTNLFLGGLRGQLELQFPNLTRLSYKLSYPSRSLNFPVYPYVRALHQNVPRIAYNSDGKEMATYDDKFAQFAAGFGLLFKRSLNVETEINYEINKSSPQISAVDTAFNEHLVKIQSLFDLDLINDLILPQRGLLIHGRFETALKNWGSDKQYYRINVNAALYETFARKHTLMLGSTYALSSGLPIYKKFLAGGPNSFIGANYDQFSVRKLGIFRIMYRYRFKKDIFIKFYFNMLFHYKQIFSNQTLPEGRLPYGFGLGVKFISIIGPLEFLYGRGQKSIQNSSAWQNIFYVTAGYIF